MDRHTRAGTTDVVAMALNVLAAWSSESTVQAAGHWQALVARRLDDYVNAMARHETVAAVATAGVNLLSNLTRSGSARSGGLAARKTALKQRVNAALHAMAEHAHVVDVVLPVLSMLATESADATHRDWLVTEWPRLHWQAVLSAMARHDTVAAVVVHGLTFLQNLPVNANFARFARVEVLRPYFFSLLTAMAKHSSDAAIVRAGLSCLLFMCTSDMENLEVVAPLVAAVASALSVHVTSLAIVHDALSVLLALSNVAGYKVVLATDDAVLPALRAALHPSHHLEDWDSENLSDFQQLLASLEHSARQVQPLA